MARTRDETVRDLVFIDQASPGPSELGIVRLENGDLLAEDQVGQFNLRQGAAADTKDVLVSADDTTAGFLEDKVVAALPLETETLAPAGNEQLNIKLADPISACQIIAAVGAPPAWKIRTPLMSCDGWLTNDQFEPLYVEEDGAP